MVFGIDISFATAVITIAYLILVAGALLYFAYLGRRQEKSEAVPGATEELDESSETART